MTGAARVQARREAPLPVTLAVPSIGGYGTFGGRLCQLLADEPRLRLLVAGRSLERAEAFWPAAASTSTSRSGCRLPGSSWPTAAGSRQSRRHHRTQTRL